MRKLQAYGQEFKSMDERCLILIWTDDSQIFRAEIPNGRFPPGDEVLNNAIGERVPENHLFPPWSDTLTEAQQPLGESADVFVKKPYGALLFYDGTPSAAERCMKEIRALEFVSKNPHPNVVKYLGCIRNGDAVGGICLEKYVCTLMDLVQGKVSVDQSPPFQPDVIISEIRAGIDHLHSLGLVHNDINPMNIMVDKAGNAIITDFDSCVPVGAPCDPGTPGWSQLRTPNKVAAFENDAYGLDLVSKECSSLSALPLEIFAFSLVHGDINPSNIMINNAGNAIVTDFDSCVVVGAPCDAGTPGWSPCQNRRIAAFENDFYGLDLVAKFIRGEYDGLDVDEALGFVDIPRNSEQEEDASDKPPVPDLERIERG